MALAIDELKVTMESPARWARRLRITVPAEQVARERRQALKRLAGKVNLPGFRKGKVPAHVVEKRFGPAVEQEMLERVMGEAYRQILRREGLQPITDGSIDNVEYKAGADLTFDVGFEVRPEIELERIGGFTVKRPPVEVTDEQVDRVLDRLRDENTQWQPFEGDEAMADGDMVVVQITPLGEDGPGQPRRYEVVLGQEQVVPAIETVIRDMKPGDEGEFTVELPENADDPDSPVAPHRIHLALHEARHPDRPVADDAWARSLGDFADLETLRARIRDDLKAEGDREADRAVGHQLLTQVVEANPFELPASMVNDYLGRLVPDREDGDDQVADARASVRPAAENGIRRMLVIERIADMESLAPTPAELDERLGLIAERTGRPVAEVRESLRRSGRLAELAHEMTERKVIEYLTTLSTIE